MSDPSPRVERIMFTTFDPEPRNLDGETVRLPALTTMLYRVCGNDQKRFDEATRLVQLFIEAALADG
jgi:hypothetical protein